MMLQAVVSKYEYSIYGLRVRIDRPLPGLSTRCNPSAPVVSVSFVGPTAWTVEAMSGPGRVRFDSGDAIGDLPASVRVWAYPESGAFQFVYRDGVEFVVDGSRRRISIRRYGAGTADQAVSYLLGMVLGFALRLDGRLALHASTVVVDDRAVVLLGESGSGKSTAAATFAEAGYEILADNVCVPAEIDGTFVAEPGYPGIRLWPDSVQSIFGSPEALPRIAQGWDKRYLNLSPERYRFGTSSRSIGAFYRLGKHRRFDGASTIGPLSPSELMMKLISASYPEFLLDAEIRSREFETLARLAERIPGRSVRASEGLASTADTCESIVEDFRQLRTNP